ncbi:glycosyltransferase family 4 protein [Vallitalea okinawensis]|uniref:glycosyltransferase family 4 protein n=1 Tax=Vallitalea okinawensis TaxID=2078660 RepID=UPI000CFC3C6F|nr:glycosyltransferase family 4 protein [Vallitalea okinawensis]
MNIGIFTDCYYPQINGVVTSVRILEEELLKRGHNVTIITVDIPGYIEESDHVIRVKSVPFSKWKEFRIGVPFLPLAYKTVKSLNLDLIHTHTEFSIGHLGRYLAKVQNIPILHTYHTMYEDYTHYVFNSKYGKNMVRKLIKQGSKLYVKKYDAIIVPTDKTKSALLGYGVTNNIHVVPTGINIEHFDQHDQDHPKLKEIRNELGIQPDDYVILSLGRISEEKSIDLTIKQMKRLIIHEPHAKLIIVGDGPYRQTLEKLTLDMNLDNCVHFVGRVPFDDVSYYYSLAKVFVSASKTETQGLTIMESMASMLPVIVYDDDNVKGIVINGYSGRLFNTESELTTCIIDAIRHPDMTNQMTHHAFDIVQSLSKEAFGENAEKVYQEVLRLNTIEKIAI